MNKKICIVQINYTDFENFNMNYNNINILKESKLFENIVLAAPDIKKNKIVVDFAIKHNIEYFLGDIYNVSQRLLDCSNFYNAKIIVRVLINWFFLDMQLIKISLNYLQKTNAECIKLPNNFDIRFVGDIFTIDFLNKVIKCSHNENNNKQMLFNPWGYADGNADKFNVFLLEDIPSYSEEKILEIKKKFDIVWPESHKKTLNISSTYKLIKSYFGTNNSNMVLDIACGFANGSIILSDLFNQVIAVDLDPNTIQHNKDFNSKPNIKYQVGNAENLQFENNFFDAIVSIHTLEHLHNDETFLISCTKILKKNGLLCIEVPLHRDYPIKQIISKYHIREYKVDEFEMLISKYFNIIDIYGVTRGFYVSKKAARESILIICKNKE